MKERLSNWSLLVKPTHDCNLNCQYCYDAPHRRNFAGKKMSFETVDKILTLCEDYAENVQWIWHGGEPTLMGVDWYKRVQELFYAHDRTKFTQHMQSNGMLLDEKWAELSLKYGIDIGVSFDVFNQDVRVGSKMVNIEDRLRKYTDAGGHLGCITVINKTNYQRQIELYNYFKNNYGFSPAFNHIYRTDGSLSNELEISAEDFAKEFGNFYKYWIEDTDIKATKERTASLMTELVAGQTGGICTYSDCRKCWVGINPIGDIYPCDRFVPDVYKMGNISDIDYMGEVYKAEGHILYSTEIQKRFMTHCAECGFFPYCRGGCNANHIAVAGDGTGIDSFSCDLFKLEMSTAYNVLREVDIYNKKYNKNFILSVLSNPLITVKEIKNLFVEKGISRELSYGKEGKNLINCQEFKIFRVFNAYRGEIGGHTNYVKPSMNLNVSVDEAFDMNTVKEERMRMIEEIFEKNEQKIIQIIMEG